MKKLLNSVPVKRRVPLRPGLYVLIATVILSACNTQQKPQEKPKAPLTELPYKTIQLDTLKNRLAAWQLAGNIFMNGETENTEPGSEIVYHPRNEKPLPFTPGIIHGDLDLDLDFMLSEGSQLTIDFKNRYALLLYPGGTFNSMSEKKVSGIYDQNAFKAAGLWQHLHVRFINPEFDASGKITGAARLEDVILNGKQIKPEGAFELAETMDEKLTEEISFEPNTKGPGAIALRNIRYKTYTDDRITLAGVQYSVFKGIFKEYDTLKTLTPLRTGNTDSLHWKVGDKRAQVAFAGTMNVPQTGAYLFRLRAGGPAWLLIDNKEIVNNHGTRDFVRPFYDSVYLKAGDHPFQVIYANYDQSLVLDYEGPGIPFTRLSDPAAERHEEQIEPLEYVVTTEPGIQRGFFMHHGVVNTYTMAIGIPGGINYAYDMNTYSLLSAWRGRFIDVSNMWTSRGESQRELPLGTVLELSGTPTVQFLADEKGLWQDTVAADITPFTKRAYRIDTDGLPVFQYTFRGATIEDRWRASADGKGLTRSVTISNAAEVSDVYFLLGNGSKVEKVPQGGYAIDDKAYFLSEPSGIDNKALNIVKAGDGRYALMLPLAGPAGKRVSFQYTILW